MLRSRSMPLLFSYGTLQDERVQLATFGRRLDGHEDEIVGYQPSRVRIADATIAAALGRTHHANATFTGAQADRVAGTVFTVTDGELDAADGYERPADYVRVIAILASGEAAWVYVHRADANADHP
jgi:gamma-glutamylcyclotransferase (GGCT)/AIG2-like uncharacterized protein YtfP